MFQLSESGQIYLLRLARQAIREYLQSGQKPTEIPTSEELLGKRGAFVTLYRQGLLRGCIGYVTALFPLYKTVIQCSVSAAIEDPRFAPLQLAELAEVRIETSVLSPLKIVNDVNDIEIGIHGLIISHKGRRGLLLPQVPLEYSWNRERFLQETCRKAGLPLDTWQRGATIECFSAFVFKEGDAIADCGLQIGD